jgi:hypothetical protein
MIPDLDEFWLVWCPTGNKSPSHRHSSEGLAIVEAERLARAVPGQKFYVLHATELRCVDAMQRVILFKTDQPPF